MFDCLASSRAVIHSDIEAVRVIFLLQFMPDPSDELPNLALCFLVEIKDAFDVLPSRKYQRMPLGKGAQIMNRKKPVRF